MDGRFQKGHSKSGGIKKGGHHKITSELRALLDELGCNPIEGLALIAMNEQNPVEVRRRAYADLGRYIHPQLQSVEFSGPAGGPIQHEHSHAVEDLESRVAGIVARLGSRAGDPLAIQ
jgi:hypothetical protein